MCSHHLTGSIRCSQSNGGCSPHSKLLSLGSSGSLPHIPPFGNPVNSMILVEYPLQDILGLSRQAQTLPLPSATRPSLVGVLSAFPDLNRAWNMEIPNFSCSMNPWSAKPLCNSSLIKAKL